MLDSNTPYIDKGISNEVSWVYILQYILSILQLDIHAVTHISTNWLLPLLLLGILELMFLFIHFILTFILYTDRWGFGSFFRSVLSQFFGPFQVIFWLFHFFSVFQFST